MADDELDFAEVDDAGDFDAGDASDSDCATPSEVSDGEAASESSSSGSDGEQADAAAPADDEVIDSMVGASTVGSAQQGEALRRSNTVYREIAVAGDARILSAHMDDFERAAVLSERAAQIAASGLHFLEPEDARGLDKAVDLAVAELRLRRCPLVVRRLVKTDHVNATRTYEIWPANEMT
jgi:DNA-directed RNA polymerase subunit K/omega